MPDPLKDFVEKLHRTTSAVSIAVSATSGWLSFLTYREFMAGSGLSPEIAEFTAGLTGLGCAALLHFANSSIAGGIPLVGRWSRPRFIPMTAILMAAVAAFSTYTNVITTSGNEALRIHQARHQDNMLVSGVEIQGAALSASQLVPALAAKATDLKAQAECEATKGCLSGTPGHGDLTDALISASAKVMATASALAQARQEIAALAPALNAALANGDEFAIRSTVAEIRGKIPFDAMRSTAATLRNGLGIKGTARSPDVRARQDAAIAQIERDLAAIATGLEEAAARVDAQLSGAVVPDRETITKARAIWMYADQLVPQIALGIAMDWMLILAAFFMAMLRDEIAPEAPSRPGMTLDDLRRNYREIEAFKNEIAPKNEKPREPVAGMGPGRSTDGGFWDAA